MVNILTLTSLCLLLTHTVGPQDGMNGSSSLLLDWHLSEPGHPISQSIPPALPLQILLLMPLPLDEMIFEHLSQN